MNGNIVNKDLPYGVGKSLLTVGSFNFNEKRDG